MSKKKFLEISRWIKLSQYLYSVLILLLRNLFLLCLFCHLLITSINPLIFYLNELIIHYNGCQNDHYICNYKSINDFFLQRSKTKHLYMFPLLITTCETKPFGPPHPTHNDTHNLILSNRKINWWRTQILH